MTIGFIPSVIPEVAEWARTSPDTVYSALISAERSADTKQGVSGLSDPLIVPIEPDRARVMAIAFEKGIAVVLAAGRGLTQGFVERIAGRLARANWQSRLVTIDLDGLEHDELAATLLDVLGAMDLTEAPVARFATIGLSDAGLVDAVKAHAQPWQTKIARDKFKGLMEAAGERPQLVSRPGGDPVYVVAESVLDAYANPVSAPELVAAFTKPPGDMRMDLHNRPQPRPAIAITASPGASLDDG